MRGEPYVLDFGLASSAVNFWSEASQRPLTASGQVVGSLPWASPEQITRGTIDGRSDIYSMGVMLYQAIAGCFPYPVDGEIREVLDHIALTAPPPPCRQPKARPASRPDLLDAIVLRALAKNPNDRYGTSGEFGLDLLRHLEGHAVSAPPASRGVGRLARKIADWF